jgi:hypothetical protein
MNKAELKKLLKPLIKECVKEVIFEDGTLSTVISEVVKGLGNPLSETRSAPLPRPTEIMESDIQAKARRKRMVEHQQSLMDSIGKEAYNGVNLFEGTAPAPAPREGGRGPLSGVDPNDPGVDISSFMGSGGSWKKLAGN